MSFFSPNEVSINRTPKRQRSESIASVTIPAAHPKELPEASADDGSINGLGVGAYGNNSISSHGKSERSSICEKDDDMFPKALLEATAAGTVVELGVNDITEVETVGAAVSGSVVHCRTKKIGKPRAPKYSRSASKHKKNSDYSAFRKPTGDRTKKMARPRLGSRRRSRIIAVVEGRGGDQNSCGDTENSDSTSDDGNPVATSIVGYVNGTETEEENGVHANSVAEVENNSQYLSMTTETGGEYCEEIAKLSSSSSPSIVERSIMFKNPPLTSSLVRGNSTDQFPTDKNSKSSREDSTTIDQFKFGVIVNRDDNESIKLDGENLFNDKMFIPNNGPIPRDNKDISTLRVSDTNQLESNAAKELDAGADEEDDTSRFSEVSETSGNQCHFGGSDISSAFEEDNLLQSSNYEGRGMSNGNECASEIGFAPSKLHDLKQDWLMSSGVDDCAPNMLLQTEHSQQQQQPNYHNIVKLDKKPAIVFDDSSDEHRKIRSNTIYQSTSHLKDSFPSGAEESNLNSIDVTIGGNVNTDPSSKTKRNCHRTNVGKNDSEDGSHFGSYDEKTEKGKENSSTSSQTAVGCKLSSGVKHNSEVTSDLIQGNQIDEVSLNSKASDAQNGSHHHPVNEYGTFEPPTRELNGEDSDCESSVEGSVYSISAQEQTTKDIGCDFRRKKRASTMPPIQLPHGSTTVLDPLNNNEDESKIKKLARQFKERQDQRECKQIDVAGARTEKKVSFGQITVCEVPRRRVLGRAARAMKKEIPDIARRENTANLQSNSPPRAHHVTRASKAMVSQNDPIDDCNEYIENQWKYGEKQWSKHFDSVLSYIRNHNDCNVPDGHSLQKWITRERNTCLRLMRKSTRELFKESSIKFFTKLYHIVKLNSIGFDFGKASKTKVAEFISSASARLSSKQRAMLNAEEASLQSLSWKGSVQEKKRNPTGKVKYCKKSRNNSISNERSEVGFEELVEVSEIKYSEVTSRSIEKETFKSNNDQIVDFESSVTGLQDGRKIFTPTSSSKHRNRMSAKARASGFVFSEFDTNASIDQNKDSFDKFERNASERRNKKRSIFFSQMDSAGTDEGPHKTKQSEDSNLTSVSPLTRGDDRVEGERSDFIVENHQNVALVVSKHLRHLTDIDSLHQSANKSLKKSPDEESRDMRNSADNSTSQEAEFNLGGTDSTSSIAPKKRFKTESHNEYDENSQSLEKKPRKSTPEAYEESPAILSPDSSSACAGKSGDKSELIIPLTPVEMRWQQRLQEWKEFDESGQGRDPPSSTMKRLANRVKRQRTEYRFLEQGKKSSMTSSHIHLLEQAGFKWKKELDGISPVKASKTALASSAAGKTSLQDSNERTSSFDVAKSNLIKAASLTRATSSIKSAKVVLVSSQRNDETTRPSMESSSCVTMAKSEFIENTSLARGKISGNIESKLSVQVEPSANIDGNISGVANAKMKSHCVEEAQGFEVGDEVYAAWGIRGKKKKALYYPGSVKNIEEVGTGSLRHRLYRIAFEDGDVACNVEESEIILKHEYLKANLKPLLEVGDACYAAWWPSKGRRDQPAWYPGKIRSYKEKVGGRYGPVRLYDITYDDGDKLNGVEDFYVFSKSEYKLSLQKPVDGGTSGWTGVRNKTDKTSIDKWANLVGYYVANIDGEDKCFSLLSSALRSYDDYIIRTKGAKTKKTDLNLPGEFRFKSRCKPTRIFALEVAAQARSKSQGTKKIKPDPLSSSLSDKNTSDDDGSRKSTSSLTLKTSDIMSRWQQRQYKVVHVESGREQEDDHVDFSEKSDPDEDIENDYDMSVTPTHSNIRTKPVITKNEQVYAVWSEGNDDNCWYPGRVWEAHVVEESFGYGPVKKYDIVFDDGDVESGVDEVFVMKKDDYEIGVEKEEGDWVGVTNYRDETSKDRYARLVGWYEFTTASGEHRIYSSLNDALHSYDEIIIKERGRPNLLASQLNFP